MATSYIEKSCCPEEEHDIEALYCEIMKDIDATKREVDYLIDIINEAIETEGIG